MNENYPQVRVFSVSQLIEKVNGLFGRVGIVSVEGEISQITVHAKSGHMYFSLKDDQSRLDCALWERRARTIGFRPKVGDKVRLTGRFNVYAPSGKFTYVAETMILAGDGYLLQKYLELKARLGREGLFDPALKRPYPLAPRTVGIITGEGTAALNDALTYFSRHAPYARAIVYPAVVQGVQGVASIRRALAVANNQACADVLLLIRGGGSLEDLWCFNDEQLARDIRASRIPVITGIGHSTDETIADLASDCAKTTPTAAAMEAAQDKTVLLDAADKSMQVIRASLDKSLYEAENNVSHASVFFERPEQLLDLYGQSLSRSVSDLQWNAKQSLSSSSSLYQAGMQDFYRSRSDSTEVLQANLRSATDALRLQVDLRRPSGTLDGLLQSLRVSMEGRLRELGSAVLSSRPAGVANLDAYAQNLAFSVNLLRERKLGVLDGLSADLKSSRLQLRLFRPKISNENLKRSAALLSRSAQISLTANASRLVALESRFTRLDPQKVLAMGYAMVRQNGSQVFSAAELSGGGHITLQFSDGTVNARVEDDGKSSTLC